MNFDANKHTSDTDKSTLVFLQTWGDLGLTVMNEFADLQFTFASTQMESVYGQLDLLGNVRTINYFLSDAPVLAGVYGTREVNISRKPAKLHAVPEKKPVIQADKKIRIMATTKTRAGSRRKTRKKRS